MPRPAISRSDVRMTSVGMFPALVAGTGAPAVFLAGLFPVAGVDGALRRTHTATMLPWTGSREVYYLNRHRGMPAGMSFSEIAAEHAQALSATFGEPVDLIGLSTGGSIAQQLAAEHPEAVRRLVLVSTGCRLGPVAKEDQRRTAARIRRGAVRQAGALMAAAMTRDPRSVPALVAAAGGWTVTPRLFGAHALGDMATTIEAEDTFDLAALPRIAAPTLLVGGGQDPFYPVELIEETVALIPGAQLDLRPNAGHVSVLAEPGVIPGALAFLEG